MHLQLRGFLRSFLFMRSARYFLKKANSSLRLLLVAKIWQLILESALFDDLLAKLYEMSNREVQFPTMKLYSKRTPDWRSGDYDY